MEAPWPAEGGPGHRRWRGPRELGIAVWTIRVNVEENEVFNASQILADLRMVAETLFHPMRLVGFWDGLANGMHLCPHEGRKMRCPHKLPHDDPSFVEYSRTAEREMDASLEVVFPHAQVHIYLK